MSDDSSRDVWADADNTGSPSSPVEPVRATCPLPTQDEATTERTTGPGELDEAEIDRCAREFVRIGSCFSATVLTAAAMQRFQQRVAELSAE